MSHECIDWEAAPPRPKTPFITISYGSTKVVTRRGAGFKVWEFKALETFVQRTFSTQCRPPPLLRFRTTCNLGCAPVDCDSVYEVSEEAWEEEGLRELVGCLEVSLCKDEDGKVMPGPVKNLDEPPSRVDSPQLSYVNGESGAELSQQEHEPEDADADERIRVSDERQESEGEISNAENHDAGAAPEEMRAREILDGEKDSMSDINSETKEEQIALRARPSGRAKRRVIVSDEEDGETPDRNLATDTRPSASIAGVLHPVDLLQTSDTQRLIKKEKEKPVANRDSDHRLSVAGSSTDSRAHTRASQSIDLPVKQEPVSRTTSQPKAGRATQEAEPIPDKLIISIQHKPSAQHAQFSTKPHTRVGKVLAGACKSFRLEFNLAQLYLVVMTENDSGLKEEDYFLCDRGDTVETAVAGLEGNAEFVIRMPKDPAM